MAYYAMRRSGSVCGKGDVRSMKSKKIASAAIGACLALSLTPAVAFAADFQDTEGHWAEAAIDRWGDSGVVNGVARCVRARLWYDPC